MCRTLIFVLRSAGRFNRGVCYEKNMYRSVDCAGDIYVVDSTGVCAGVYGGQGRGKREVRI